MHIRIVCLTAFFAAFPAQGASVEGYGKILRGAYVPEPGVKSATPANWKPVKLTEQESIELQEKTRHYIKKTQGEKVLGRTIYFFPSVFRSGRNKIEFVSTTIADKEEHGASQDPYYGISLAWGLTDSKKPFVFYPFQQVGADPAPHYYPLTEALDIRTDGTIELIFCFNDNQERTCDIWQGNGENFKRLGQLETK